jgi:beta-xylosidase
VIQRSNISDGEPRNFLVREAPAGNFEITTSLRFTPAGAYQVAGLLVYQTQGNALQFGPAYAACPGGIGGQCVYYDNFARGQWIQPNFATFTGGGSPAYLKLRRMGSSYTASYRADGSTWKEIGTHQNDLAPAFVGLVAAQGYASEAPADFDYFTLEEVR